MNKIKKLYYQRGVISGVVASLTASAPKDCGFKLQKMALGILPRLRRLWERTKNGCSEHVRCHVPYPNYFWIGPIKDFQISIVLRCRYIYINNNKKNVPPKQDDVIIRIIDLQGHSNTLHRWQPTLCSIGIMGRYRTPRKLHLKKFIPRVRERLMQETWPSWQRVLLYWGATREYLHQFKLPAVHFCSCATNKAYRQLLLVSANGSAAY